MDKILKLGFIGGGINSAIGETHRIASQMDGRFELVAGCFSRNKTSNELTAKQWLIPSYYPNYEELIESEKNHIDALVVLTPTNMHTEVILRAIEAGIPVICEKTVTTSLQDIYRIKKSLEKTGSFLVTTYNYTGYPMIRELEAMISEGKLGKIIQIHIQMPQESYIRLDKHGNIPKPQSWRLEDPDIPMLSLDLGTHLSNMISFLTKQRPLEVVAMQNTFGHHSVVDNIMCLTRYSENIDCQLWYSKSALGHKNGLKVEVYGTEGSAVWYQMNPEFLVFNDNRGRNIILDRSSKDILIADKKRYNRFKSGHPAGFIEAFANYYYDIYNVLIAYKNGKEHIGPYLFGVDDAIEGLALMRAIELSVENRSWEPIHA
jgi:predicted dehydrogenase